MLFTKAGTEEISDFVKDEGNLNAEAVMGAEKESRLMLRGIAIDPPEPEEDHKIHLMTHDRIAQSQEYQDAINENPQIEQLFNDHIAQHEQMEQEQMMQEQMPQQPPVGTTQPQPSEQELANQLTNANKV